MREEFARAADARLHLVEHEQHAALVAELPQRPEPLGRDGTDPALPLHRLDEDRARLRRERGLERLVVAERDLVEALDLRAEALEVLLLPAGRDGRERAAMKGAPRR
jgi:hypothetical protein